MIPQRRQVRRAHPVVIIMRTTRREKERKPGRRTILMTRDQLLQKVAAEIPPHFFEPAEAMALLFGRLESAHRAVRNARLRFIIRRSGCHSIPAPAPDCSSPRPARPGATLSRLNRSSVFPSIFKMSGTGTHLAELLPELRRQHGLGRSPVDLLQLPLSVGFSWSAAAGLVSAVSGVELQEDDLAVLVQAQHFWSFYGEGRARYAVLAAAGDIARLQGDFAFFSARELDSLLPGVILPDHCQRGKYLTNYVHADPSLDIYSCTGIPLVRHPFPEKFNPLTFGKPNRPGLLSLPSPN